MPTWAFVGFAAVTAAICMTLTTLGVASAAQNNHWTLGQATLAITVSNLTVIIIILTILSSVLRYQDRRNR